MFQGLEVHNVGRSPNHTITAPPPKILPTLSSIYAPAHRPAANPPTTLKPKLPMSTQKQIDANRRNAQKSTSPHTPAGLAAVRLNGVKHGLCAKTLVLEGESERDY